MSHFKINLRALPLFLCFTVLSTCAYGWGPSGHRVVGKIAQNHLTDAAKKKVFEILEGATLAEVSTWADDVRSDPQYKNTAPWHFVEIKMGEQYDPKKADPAGDVYQSIEKMKATLLKTDSTADQKKEALKFLVHFVGDVHQPLHVGNAVDKGANDCLVKWFGKSTNFHAVWDSEMIDSTKLSYSELAEFIDRPTGTEIAAWQSSSTLDWLNDAIAIREGIYPANVGEIASGADVKPEDRVYCQKGTKANNQPALGYDYEYQFLPLLKNQLLKGGIRLAGVLNTIFQ